MNFFFLHYCLLKKKENNPSIVDFFFPLLYRNRIEPWPPNRGTYRTVTSVYLATPTVNVNTSYFTCYILNKLQLYNQDFFIFSLFSISHYSVFILMTYFEIFYCFIKYFYFYWNILLWLCGNYTRQALQTNSIFISIYYIYSSYLLFTFYDFMFRMKVTLIIIIILQ